MGLSSTIFTKKWADAVFGTWSTFLNAQITIFTPGKMTYDDSDPKNPKYVDDPQNPVVTHWSGPARLKEIRSSERNLVLGDDGQAQAYRVQIPRNSVTLSDTMRMRVTDGGLNTDLPNHTFYIVDFYNQSAAFEQTFTATVNSGRP